MRTLRIRKLMLLFLLFILLLPWLLFLTAHFIETGTLRFSSAPLLNEKQQMQQNEIIGQIEANMNRWSVPEWQVQLKGLLDDTNMNVSLLSAAGKEIYRSNADHNNRYSSVERYTLLADGQIKGKIELYIPKTNQLQVFSILIGFLLALLVISMAMRYFLIKPLERLSTSVRLLASGDWNVPIPASHIKEIADVRDAFDEMVQGLQTSHLKQTSLEEERRFVIAAVAHDLRTPLFALRGYLEGLELGIAQSQEKTAKYVAVCKEKALQLHRLVEDLFTFSKMDYSEDMLLEEVVNLHAVLQQSVESVAPSAQQKNISINLHLTGTCIVRGDAHLLERAISNLLDNAVRYTPDFGKMIIECNSITDQVRFTIRDTGSGFAENELKRVFEPLFRGEMSRNRSTGGSGLGMAISERIIRRHGGELMADNDIRGGALLSGWLPSMN
ncbi:sensor histidine kinase [Paenibacillus sp. P13VS]|uniref:sensor histidine kinase n=1 Tax=Paenibacillus sp. P13VS TaxID=2697367 RepID=UPI00187B712B|nr:HAMP domain-containing sensor histidine kinase [Paenibacillus sp. P13VS]MBE7680229.1 HAMP domain-containing protein [Paenibacillus sp. P13VS]